eukprot:gene13313-15733_t
MCTLGPACSEEGQMFELLSAGMNIARFQLSQGNHKSQQQLLDRFRSAVSSSGCAAATLLDTQGPEITVGRLDRHEPIYLETGDTMVVRGCGPEEFASFVGYRNEEETKVAVSYERLCQQIKPGDPMWFNDGQIKLEVKVGLPSLRLDLPVLSPKDVADVQAFCSGDDAMDFLALSFTQSAEDVAEARRVLDAGGGKLVRIIAKIETALGLANFDAILRAADGIYVDRGDLGMNIPMEKVALATKMMVAKCNIAGKPSIVAGNILQSMGESKTPSHPEMSDVANLIIDGCETLMLDRETAYGLHPLRVVSELRNIIRTAALGIDFHAQMDFIRRHYVSQQENNHLTSLLCSVATRFCSSPQLMAAFTILGHRPWALGVWCCMLSLPSLLDTGSSDGTTSMILVLTRTGAAADLVSMFHPPCTVLVASEDPRLFREQCAKKAEAMRIEFGATCIPSWPTMMATRGTEVKTTKLQNHKRITLTVGQTIKMVVCDDDDLSFEGYQTEEETKIGLAYACLCGSVRPGDLITISRGNIVVKVTQILGRAEVHGVVTKASIKLGEKKPFNIPGNHVEKEVLSEKDLKDLKFCIENNMDALVVPFTQTDYDVRSVREALDAEGGHGVKIIASIDTIVGLQNLNSILLVADGIMCSRERCVGTAAAPSALCSLTTIRWAQHGWRPTQMEDLEGVISEACEYIVAKSFCKLASKLIVVSGVSSIFADDDCTVQTITVPGVQPGDRTDGADELSASYDASKSLTQPLLLPRFLSSTTLSDISQGTERLRARKTKLICTIGPRATTAQQICGMLDAGLDAAYFDFSI